MSAIDKRLVWASIQVPPEANSSGSVSGGGGAGGASGGMRLSEVEHYVRKAGEEKGEVHLEVFREELVDVRDRLHDVRIPPRHPLVSQP